MASKDLGLRSESLGLVWKLIWAAKTCHVIAGHLSYNTCSNIMCSHVCIYHKTKALGSVWKLKWIAKTEA